MKSSLFLWGLLLSLGAAAQTVSLEWVKQMGGSNNEGGKDVAIDAAGNIYSTGFFTGSVDFDPGPGVFLLTAPQSSEEDVFITKFTAQGDFVWAKQFSGNFLDVAYSLEVDAQGNVYLTGIFFSSCDFDPGPGVFTLASAGNEDVFIVKLDAAGNLAWANRLGSGLFDRSNSIALDKTGNVYVTGYFLQTVDFDPGAGVFTMTAQGGEDMFIVKFTNNGGFLWAKQMGGPQFEGGYSVSVSALGNIYASGIFLGTADFDPGPAVFNLTSSGLSDAFVCKLDGDGNFKWARSTGGTGYMRSFVNDIDAAENIYTTGFFDKQVDFDPGPASFLLTSFGEDDIFINRLDSNGNFSWARQIGGSSYDAGNSLALDATGNIYVTGFFQNATDFDPGPGTAILTSAGFSDIFLLKLTAAGNFMWVKKAGGASFDIPGSVKVDAANKIYVIGAFEQTVDFDPGPSVANLTSKGGNDIFVWKLSQCLTQSSSQLTASTCTNYILNNEVYRESGIYTQIIPNAAGCDSTITLTLTITRPLSFKEVSICQGERFFAGGKFQTSSGNYGDTLVTSTGCDSVILTRLTVKPSPLPNLGPDKNICAGEKINLNPGNFTSYLWSNGQTVPSITVTTAGFYWVKVTNENNCSTTDTFTIKTVNPIPAGFLPANRELCVGDALLLDVPGYAGYAWSSGQTSSGIIIRNAGTISLQVKDMNQCTGTDTLVISAKINCLPFAIPNTFTPNNDGQNDVFRPVFNLEIEDYSMVIFNRWGKKVMETNNKLSGWDGREGSGMAAQGSYVYLIRYKNIQGIVSLHKGSVTLLY
jgi:gliding motility-associated-like protein